MCLERPSPAPQPSMARRRVGSSGFFRCLRLFERMRCDKVHNRFSASGLRPVRRGRTNIGTSKPMSRVLVAFLLWCRLIPLAPALGSTLVVQILVRHSPSRLSR